MTTAAVNPSYFNLQRAILRFEFASIQEIDITALIPAIELNSSITSETMFGKVRVVDSAGLLEETPLRGEEQLILEIADAKMINENGGESGVVSQPYRFVGFVYKIDNVSAKEVNDSITYDMHFVSYQSSAAGTFNIVRSFRDKRVSEIVQTIFNDYYTKDTFLPSTSAKTLKIEETDGTIRCIIPRMRPEEAMTFLSKRAYSSNNSPSCTYRFFENSRSYHFVTDEHLFRLAEQDDDRKFTFTFLDAIPKTMEYFDAQRNNLEMIDNSRRINTFDDIYHGAYRNKVLMVDILRRTTNLLDDTDQFNYFERRNKYFDVNSFQQLQDRHTEAFINKVHKRPSEEGRDEDIQQRFIIVANYDVGLESANDESSLPAELYYPQIISNRQAYAKHIESITVNAVGPGRLDVTAGDIVTLDIKKLQFADNNESTTTEQNKHLSGRYIVKTVSHVMELEEMKNHYVLIKKDWSNTTLRIGEDGRLIGGL